MTEKEIIKRQEDQHQEQVETRKIQQQLTELKSVIAGQQTEVQKKRHQFEIVETKLRQEQEAFDAIEREIDEITSLETLALNQLQKQLKE